MSKIIRRPDFAGGGITPEEKNIHRSTTPRIMARAGYVPIRGWFKKSRAAKLEAETKANVAKVMAEHKKDPKDV